MKNEISSRLQLFLASPYASWILINIIGWSLGLYVVALSLRFLGIIGGLIGTGMMGLVVGIGQAWILKRFLPISYQHWGIATLMGVILGASPVALLFVWVLLIAVLGLNSVLVILGGLLGGVLGGTQAYILYPIVYDKARWWVIANLVAGALCAPLSLTGTTFWLPIFCSLGPLTFGLLTALGLRYIVTDLDIEHH